MDKYTSYEIAYKNGYKDGYKDGYEDGKAFFTEEATWELEEYQCGVLNVDQSYRCSNCKNWADTEYGECLTPYCPMCGKKMKMV